MKVHANKLAFEFQIEGKTGAPWVILSHSIATDNSMWEEQARALGERFRVLRYDTRGHGGSEVPPRAYRMEDLVGDAVGLMDALSIEKAHYVGISLGGMTALGLALSHPQRLWSVAVCDSRADAPADFRAAWEERIQTAQAQGMEALVEPTVRRWFLPASLSDKSAVIDKVRAMIRRTSPIGFIGCARALQTLDYDTRLHAITVPTLLLAGERDGDIPELNQTMCTQISSAQQVTIPNAGHISNLEQPQAFLRALLDFLKNVET